MGLLKSVRRFWETFSYVMNPPPEYHERLARNLKMRIEQEQIRDQWHEIWNRKEMDNSCGLQSDQTENT